MEIANGAIAVVYLAIPITLLPLLEQTTREVRVNLLLTILFVFSCGIGHGLESLGLHTPWHWVTAAISLIALITLIRSRTQLRYLGRSLQILEATWDQALTGKLLCERRGDDLVLLKMNSAAQEITKGLIRPGELFTEKVPLHLKKAYPYDVKLIDLYIQILESGESKRLEYQITGEISGWFLNLVTPLSDTILYMAFAEVSGMINDPLTGMYNRRALEMEIDDWVACLFIDLDRFKLINDHRGHHLGDRLLVEVAQGLRSRAEAQRGIAIRNGGDEFLILLPATGGSMEQAMAMANVILTDILAIEVDGTSTSASIGVAVGPIHAFEDDSPVDRLIQAAETALREAKASRSSVLPEKRIQSWDDDMASFRLRQITLEAHLSQRSSEDEFWLAYQPICNMRTGEIVGAEALIRWDSLRLGAVGPDEFIPVAEATGLVARISDWVLCKALEQMSEWQAIAPRLNLSINLSPMELEDNDFLSRIQGRVSGSGINQGNFGIEITERGIYSNLERYLESLKGLREMSLRLKVDDFGTGQAGLAQLLKFRFDEVKVDRCLIPINSDDLEKIAICRAIASLSEGINFCLVAEGIENEEQRDLMIDLDYEYGQGYFFAMPMRAKDFTTLLKEKTALSPKF